MTDYNHKWIQIGFDLLGSPANPNEPNERVYYRCETCDDRCVTLERAGVVLKETVTQKVPKSY